MPEIFLSVKEGDTLTVGNHVVKGPKKNQKLVLDEGFWPVTVYPFSAKCETLSGAVVLGKSPEAMGRLKLTAYADGTYGLTYKVKQSGGFAAGAKISTSGHFKGNKVDVSIYDRGGTEVVLGCGDEKLCIFPKQNLNNAKIMFQPTSSALLIVVTARYEKQYLAAASFDGTFKLLYKGEADDFEFFDDSFVEITRFGDLLGRTRRSFFTFTDKGFRSVKDEFSYSENCGYELSLLPALLLEATKSGDIFAARKYLAPELRDDAPRLTDFFGKFNRYERISPSAYAVYDDSPEFGAVIPQTVEFCIKNNLIDNISIKD